MSDCGVCLSAGDGDMVDVLSEKIIRASKKNRCCECGRFIESGQQHHYVKGVFDGEFVVYRTCLICTEIRDSFACEGFVFCGLWEDLEYAFDEGINDSCFSKLQTVDAKQYLRERWMKWKGIAA